MAAREGSQGSRGGEASWTLYIAMLAALGSLAVGGCGQIERQITVTSDPPDVLVFVNDVEMGRTPVTFDYTWYGDYRFELRKEGYEALFDNRHVRARPNQWVGIDLFTEMFVPVTLTDNKKFHFTLEPEKEVNETSFIRRAMEFRDEALLGSGPKDAPREPAEPPAMTPPQ